MDLTQAARGFLTRRGEFTTAWVAVLIAGLLAAPAAGAGPGGRPGEIFTFGAGARALGMGSAQTAAVRDVTSVYYNPAGLALLPRREITFMRANLFEGATYDYLAYAQNKKKRAGGWGLDLIRLGLSGGDGRDEFNNPTGDFGYSEMAMSVAHGWRGLFHPLLSAGLKLKLLRRSLGGTGDSLYGMDLGAQFGPLLSEKLWLGAVVQNAASFKMGDTDDKLEMLVRAGASYRVVGPLSIAGDVSNQGEFRFGTEYAFGIAALRVGMADGNFSFGGGMNWRDKYRFDLALVNHPELGMSQRFSLGYRFGAGRRGGKAKPEKMTAYAQEYLDNAKAELQKRNYVKASRDIDTAIGIDPGMGKEGWKEKSDRLRRLIKELELGNRPEDQSELQESAPAAFVAYQSVQAYMTNDDDRAMLLAHAALGASPRSGTYQRLLDAMSRLTKRKKDRNQIAPPARLTALKMRQAVESVYARRFNQAVELIREALWLDPNNVLAWTRLGSAYFAMGDKARARIAYQRAVDLNPAGAAKLRAFMEQQGMTQ